MAVTNALMKVGQNALAKAGEKAVEKATTNALTKAGTGALTKLTMDAVLPKASRSALTSLLSPNSGFTSVLGRIADKNGTPLSLYHSTPYEFSRFDDSKLGMNTMYDNTAYGHFATPDKDFSSRFLDIDNTGQKGRTMELQAKIKNPITHPYGASAKYSGDELDNIVENYMLATGNGEGLDMLRDEAMGDGVSLYEEYMNATMDESPFELAKYERKDLMDKGYDGMEIVEGLKNDLVDGSKSKAPISSIVAFEGKNLSPVSHIPVQNMSSGAMDIPVERGVADRVSKYMSKPIDVKDMSSGSLPVAVDTDNGVANLGQLAERKSIPIQHGDNRPDITMGSELRVADNPYGTHEGVLFSSDKGFTPAGSDGSSDYRNMFYGNTNNQKVLDITDPYNAQALERTLGVRGFTKRNGTDMLGDIGSGVTETMGDKGGVLGELLKNNDIGFIKGESALGDNEYVAANAKAIQKAYGGDTLARSMEYLDNPGSTLKNLRVGKDAQNYRTFATSDEAREYFSKNNLGYWDRLPSSVEESIQEYTRNGYSRVNDMLRTGQDNYGYPDTDVLIEDIERGIEGYNLPDDIKVYRQSMADTYKNLNAGDTFTDKGFMSTSISPNIGGDFGKANIEINVGKGKGVGAFVGDLSSGNGDEGEFLLQRGTKFKVLGRGEDGTLKLEVVGNERKPLEQVLSDSDKASGLDKYSDFGGYSQYSSDIERVGSKDVAPVDKNALPAGYEQMKSIIGKNGEDATKKLVLEELGVEGNKNITKDMLKEFLDRVGYDSSHNTKAELWAEAKRYMQDQGVDSIYEEGGDSMADVITARLGNKPWSKGKSLEQLYTGASGRTGRLDAEYSDRLGIGRSNTPMMDTLNGDSAAGDYWNGVIGTNPTWAEGESGVSTVAHERLHAMQHAADSREWDFRVENAIEELRDELRSFLHDDETIRLRHGSKADVSYWGSREEQEARMLQSYLENEGYTNTGRDTEWGDEVKPAFDKFFEKLRELSKKGVALPAVTALLGGGAMMAGGQKKEEG